MMSNYYNSLSISCLIDSFICIFDTEDEHIDVRDPSSSGVFSLGCTLQSITLPPQTTVFAVYLFKYPSV